MSAITINGINSYSDFNALLTEKEISPPEIRTTTVSVPYRDGEIDFTAFDGKVHYQSRTLVYKFELLETSKADLTEAVSNFVNWIYTIYDCDIFDDDISGWHFHGSVSKCTSKESGNHATIEVRFRCDPYMKNSGQTISIATFVGGRSLGLYTDGTNTVYLDYSAHEPVQYQHISVSSDGLSASVSLPMDVPAAYYSIHKMNGIITAVNCNAYSEIIDEDGNCFYVRSVSTAPAPPLLSQFTLTLSRAIGSSSLEAVRTPVCLSPKIYEFDSFDDFQIICDGTPVITVNGNIIDNNNRFLIETGMNIINISNAENEQATLEYSTVRERL